MNNRSYALILNGFFYSALTVIFLITAITKSNPMLLNCSVITLFLMMISAALAFIIDQETEAPSVFILGVSFTLLLPVGIMIFIITFVVSFLTALVTDKTNKGGDYDD